MMSADCLFCRMISGEIKPKIEYEDEKVLVIHDIHPQAPFHLLIIPKQHISGIGAVGVSHIEVMGYLLYTARQVADKNSWKDYRLVFNQGAEAGQSVFHVHLHLLSGRRMSWPPG